MERKIKFIADVHMNQGIYTEDPEPYLPRRRTSVGPKYKNLRCRGIVQTVKSIASSIEDRQWRDIPNMTMVSLAMFLRSQATPASQHRRRSSVVPRHRRTAQRGGMCAVKTQAKTAATETVTPCFSSPEPAIFVLACERWISPRYRG